MSYAAIADLVERYGNAELMQLTDRAIPPAGVYDSGVVQQALNDANGVIDSYLAAQVTVPLATVPPIVNLQACKIARFYLWKDRRSEAVTADYSDALAWLKQVAQGLIPIGDSAPPTVSNLPTQTSDCRIFTREKLKGY